jgi:hypothetical protein
MESDTSSLSSEQENLIDDVFPEYLKSKIPLACQEDVLSILQPGEKVLHLENSLFSKSVYFYKTFDFY